MEETAPKLVLEPIKKEIENFIQITLGLLFFVVIYSQSIVLTSWIGCIISICIGGMCVGGGYGNFYRNKYYITQEAIVIADYKDEYVDEILFNQITTWNHYSEYQRGGEKFFLLIYSPDKRIGIEKSDYNNYDELIIYLENMNIRRDINFKKSFFFDKEIYPVKEGSIFNQVYLLSILFAAFFWIIIQPRKESNQIINFKGQIGHFTFSSKRYLVTLNLKEYPDIEFELGTNLDKSIFKSYDLIDGKKVYKTSAKNINLKVLKDEYEWKVKNQFIRKITLGTPKIDVEEYKILD